MALFVCKCLNVTVMSERIENNVDISKMYLTPTEQRDMFFSEKLLSCPLDTMRTQVMQSELTAQRNVDRWILYSCLACRLTTHAIIRDKFNVVLIPESIQATIEEVNTLKKSDNFSPVFNILVPDLSNEIDMKENVDTNNVKLIEKRSWPPALQAIGTLSKQLNQTLQSQEEAVEETVKQFQKQKYAEFEAYKEKAQRDHKILTGIVTKARESLRNDGFKIDKDIDNGPPSPQLPPPQRRRLSSLKDTNKISDNNKFNVRTTHEEDFFDTEDIFALEETDAHHDFVSDQDDYDSDRGSTDDGVRIGRGRRSSNNAAAYEMARSLPIAVPKFPGHDRNTNREKELEEEDYPQDIAASMKALANSVHGDVFERPRPRFSTQI